MGLEKEIPGIKEILSIDNEQERLNAIQELFSTSDHGSRLIDRLLTKLRLRKSNSGKKWPWIK